MSLVHHIVNVEGAIVHDGRYLLVIRGPGELHAAGTLSLVGGKVEDSGVMANVLEETLQREIREEVGVEVSDLIYVQSTAFTDHYNFPVIDIVFLCRWMAGTAAIQDADEVSEIRWLTANEVLTNPDTPDWMRNSIRRAEKMRNMLGW